MAKQLNPAMKPYQKKRAGYHNPDGVAECNPGRLWCDQPVDDWQDAHPGTERDDAFRVICPNDINTSISSDKQVSTDGIQQEYHNEYAEESITPSYMWNWMDELINDGWPAIPTLSNKSPMLKGYCAGGAETRLPITIETLATWKQTPHVKEAIELGNIGIRMPGIPSDPQPVPCDDHPDGGCEAYMIGIDIDHKKGKRGGRQLNELIERAGLSPLPVKIVHTSQPDSEDAPPGLGHGHYLLRICGKRLPEAKLYQQRLEKSLTGQPMEVEVMRPGHRHMSTGVYKGAGRYSWVDIITRKHVSYKPPPVADIPMLSDGRWIKFLTKPVATKPPKNTDNFAAQRRKMVQRMRRPTGWKDGQAFTQWNLDHPWDEYLPGKGFTKVAGGYKAPGATSVKSAEINKNGRLVHWGTTGAGILGIEQFTGQGGKTYDQLDLEAINRYGSNSQDNRTRVLRVDGYLKPHNFRYKHSPGGES